jgi:hypothetical protein
MCPLKQSSCAIFLIDARVWVLGRNTQSARQIFLEKHEKLAECMQQIIPFDWVFETANLALQLIAF